MFDEFETVADYCADSLWLCVFADAIDRAADEDSDDNAAAIRPGAGGDWKDTDYRPVPQRFKDAARRILSGLPAGILESGRTAWRDLSRCDDERFGHVLAMQILGHGVGLSDDLPCYTDRGPLTMREQYATVRRLSDAIPCHDCSAEFFAVWNPETQKVEP